MFKLKDKDNIAEVVLIGGPKVRFPLWKIIELQVMIQNEEYFTWRRFCILHNPKKQKDDEDDDEQRKMGDRSWDNY